MRLLKRTWNFIVNYWHWALLATTIVCYISVFISPLIFWPAVLLGYLIPVVIACNVLALLILVRKRKALVPLIGLLIGIPFILQTIALHNSKYDKGGISVLSYNAKLFRKAGTYEQFSTEMINWVAGDSSDIKCIQEYSSNSKWKELDITSKIVNGGYYAYTHRAPLVWNEHNLGQAIFSKYEMIDYGIVYQDTASINGCIYADVKVNNDTLRIYNVHFGSMGLNLNQYRQLKGYGWKVKRLARALRAGAVNRTEQVDSLIAHTSRSPHKFIICGDFNETPYSYNYRKLITHYSGSFEKSGKGFGFSINSLFFVLRIDHHFVSDGITPLRYRVDRSMRISDHYPTRGVYAMPTSE